MNRQGIFATVATIVSSRKGVMVLFVLVLATVYAVGVVYAAVRRSITWDDATARLFGVLLAQVATAISFIWGTAQEDAAKAKANGPAEPPKESAQ
jgi:uracil DNA glycosylase